MGLIRSNVVRVESSHDDAPYVSILLGGLMTFADVRDATMQPADSGTAILTPEEARRLRDEIDRALAELEAAN